MNKKTELDVEDTKLPRKKTLIFIILKVQMTVFTMIIQKIIVICISKPLIIS